MKCFFFSFILFIETSSVFETFEVRGKKRRKERDTEANRERRIEGRRDRE